jgi:hypothetical protein
VKEWSIVKKLTMLVIGGAGYVLGARAGRERYEQIKQQATRTWHNPQVQSAVDNVGTQAKQAGADVGSKVADVIKHADTDPASDVYQPGDEIIGPPPVPGGSRIADAAHEGTS